MNNQEEKEELQPYNKPQQPKALRPLEAAHHIRSEGAARVCYPSQ